MFLSPCSTLFTYANGNPATGFAFSDGRVSNGAMATGVSIRRFSRPHGGRRAIEDRPYGVGIDVGPRRGAVVGLGSAAERS